MPTTYLDEGVFSDLMNAVKSVRDFDREYNKEKARIKSNKIQNGNFSSIARASKDLVMSFPTICSTAVDGKTASLINKAIERNNVTQIRMIAAAVHLQGYSGIDVINRLHHNMNINYNTDDYIDTALALLNTVGVSVGESADLFSIDQTRPSYIEESRSSDGRLYSEITEDAKIEFLNSLNKKYPLNSLSENSINDYMIFDSFTNKPQVIKEDKKEDHSNDFAQARDDVISNDKKQIQQNKENEQLKFDREKFNYQKDQDKWNSLHQNTKDKFGRYEYWNQKTKSYESYLTNQLLSSDVKKANELEPTMIVLRYQVNSPNSDPTDVNTYIEDEFIAGVKSRLIPVNSQDIVDRVIAMDKNDPNMKNLIRATTKETSFSKDFVAAVAQAKIDAKKDSILAKHSGMWRSLQARSNRSKARRLMRMTNNAQAITTLVISQPEVDMITDQYNIDLSLPKVAAHFMDAYNLMGLVIVDVADEVAHFIFDGDMYFEDLSFSSLERENENSAKKAINLLNSIGR